MRKVNITDDDLTLFATEFKAAFYRQVGEIHAKYLLNNWGHGAESIPGLLFPAMENFNVLMAALPELLAVLRERGAVYTMDFEEIRQRLTATPPTCRRMIDEGVFCGAPATHHSPILTQEGPVFCAVHHDLAVRELQADERDRLNKSVQTTSPKR